MPLQNMTLGWFRRFLTSSFLLTELLHTSDQSSDGDKDIGLPGGPPSSQIDPAVLPFDLQKLWGKAKRRLVQFGDESMKPRKDSKRMR